MDYPNASNMNLVGGMLRGPASPPDGAGDVVYYAEAGASSSNEEALLQQQQQQQQQQQLSAASPPATSSSSSYYDSSVNLLLKLLFYGCVICQVILWPSIMTITFAGAMALEGLIVFFFNTSASVSSSLSEYAVLLLHGKRVSVGKYLGMCALMVYMLVFFIFFVAHETRVLPVQTTWLHPTLLGLYRFTETANTPFEDVGVTGDVSKYMRHWPFQWPKTLIAPAIGINASIAQGQGALGAPIVCGAGFDCYSAKLTVAKPPTEGAFPAARQYVPFPSQFYTADAIITPPAGVACSALEVYRINLDADRNVEHGLDYPASAAATSTTGATLPYRKCGLFGVTGWCLSFLHGFSDADYTAQLGGKCTLGKNQQLTIRLPPRAPDVYGASGRIGQDLLLVTPGATVQMRWRWHELGEESQLLNVWDQTEGSLTDQAQVWRDSDDNVAVFLKYAVACIPLLLIWFFLTVNFRAIVDCYQILMLCLFVLLPALLFYMTVGAWLPMVGCLICMLAINHAPSDQAQPGAWSPTMRHALLFLTAVCNSVQFVWVLVLVGQAEWSAFLYDGTLKQLNALSSQFIVTGEPTWVGLVLPLALTLNFAFMLGAAICVAMELLATYSHTRRATEGRYQRVPLTMMGPV